MSSHTWLLLCIFFIFIAEVNVLIKIISIKLIFFVLFRWFFFLIIVHITPSLGYYWIVGGLGCPTLAACGAVGCPNSAPKGANEEGTLLEGGALLTVAVAA